MPVLLSLFLSFPSCRSFMCVSIFNFLSAYTHIRIYTNAKISNIAFVTLHQSVYTRRAQKKTREKREKRNLSSQNSQNTRTNIETHLTLGNTRFIVIVPRAPEGMESNLKINTSEKKKLVCYFSHLLRR